MHCNCKGDDFQEMSVPKLSSQRYFFVMSAATVVLNAEGLIMGLAAPSTIGCENVRLYYEKRQ